MSLSDTLHEVKIITGLVLAILLLPTLLGYMVTLTGPFALDALVWIIEETEVYMEYWLVGMLTLFAAFMLFLGTAITLSDEP